MEITNIPLFFSFEKILKYCNNNPYKAKDTILVEASPFDRIWGIGYDAKNAMKNIDSWGENKLGKVLNQVIIELGL